MVTSLPSVIPLHSGGDEQFGDVHHGNLDHCHSVRQLHGAAREKVQDRLLHLHLPPLSVVLLRHSPQLYPALARAQGKGPQMTVLSCLSLTSIEVQTIRSPDKTKSERFSSYFTNLKEHDSISTAVSEEV